jgi:hypothetical protein
MELEFALVVGNLPRAIRVKKGCTSRVPVLRSSSAGWIGEWLKPAYAVSDVHISDFSSSFFLVPYFGHMNDEKLSQSAVTTRPP